MSQNKENNPLRTAPRVNNSVLSLTKTPQSDDFFTDSLLDASKIPTPSPKKFAFGGAYKGRRALGKTRTLRDAWNATAPSNGIIPSISDRASSTSQREQPPTPQWKDRDTTPSPPARRLGQDLTSPDSDLSSPPRGLTDVYQRIADEEDLAAQEGEFEEDDYTEDLVDGIGSGPDTPDGLEESLQLSPAIVRRNSDDELPMHADSEQNRENVVDGEVTSMSEASGLSFLKEMTDQNLAAKLTPHTVDRAKDRLRLERALRSERPVAIHSNRGRIRPSLTAENLERHSSPERKSRYDSPAASVTTDRSEPPPNVPRVWGTKAKAGKEWLRARREQSDRAIKSSPIPDSSQVDWTAAAAKVALPSTDDSSTPRASETHGTPPISVKTQSSLEKIRQWELNDFTGHSLQASNSPPVRARSTVLDQGREKEIENLERQAVTTSRLGEIRKKDSKEHLRRTTRSQSRGYGQDEPTNTTGPAEDPDATKFSGDGEAIPDTPIIVYKTTNSAKSSPGNEATSQERQSAKKSHDQLQRLARAMSSSPRGSPPPEEWSLIGPDDRKQVVNETEVETVKPDKAGNDSRKSSKEVTDMEATPQVTKVNTSAITPVVTGAWTDTILPDPATTVKRTSSSKYSETPLIKPGGWIYTPAPGKRQSSALAPIPIPEEVEEVTEDGINGADDMVQEPSGVKEVPTPPQPTIIKEPGLPKSALASILDRAKLRLISQDTALARDSNDTLNLGDATIESLEDLLTPDATDMSLIRFGAEAEATAQMLDLQSRNDPVLESELLERLSTKLDRLRTNIHDAKKGLSKLEHQVSHPSSKSTIMVPRHNTPCDACGCTRGMTNLQPPSANYGLYFAIPVPRLYTSPRKDLGQWFPRPTLLGWITLVAWCWYISESTMCKLYCHPRYAEHYDWPKEKEPEFPWALPTMLWRWSGVRSFGPVLFGPLWTLLVAITRIFGQLLGWTDGFIDDPYLGSASAAAFSQAHFGGVSSGQGVDLSMMNDEYI